MTPYEKIYGRFRLKVPDDDLARMPDEDQAMLLLEYFQTAMDMIESDGVSMDNDLSLRDDEALTFEADLSGREIEGIALYMVAAWYDTIVNSLEHTSLIMGSKDEKWTNQVDHWKATASQQETYRIRARKYFRNYGYKTYSYATEV